MRYLFISFVRKASGQIDEIVSVGKRVRDSDRANFNVILDFGENKVIKCVIESKNHDTTFEQMRKYYYKIYPNLIAQLEKEGPISVKQKKQ